ncbi:hypothetical protein Lsed01_00374 [Demequina sediminis]|uniref:Uncharacterized protein n=1 Tax=Demequina sediminis TaxID=1930058 RepID=A0ABP9WDP9_9MICO
MRRIPAAILDSCGVSAQYRDSQSEVATALDNVATGIAKGAQGVSRLLQAANMDAPVEAIASERHPTVLAALLLNRAPLEPTRTASEPGV